MWNFKEVEEGKSGVEWREGLMDGMDTGEEAIGVMDA